MEQNKRNNQILLSVIGIAILIVAVVGVTYAFFNYTRTGSANNIATGRIYFNTTQNGTLNLTNVFPIKSTELDESTLDSVTVGIVGDTTYAAGDGYLISLVDVNNTINGKKNPINYIAEVSNSGNLGTTSATYFESRGGASSLYKLNSTGRVREGTRVLTGYIASGNTGINGTLTIKAYVDADKIAISDTYPSGDVDEDNDEVIDYTNGTTSSWVNGRTVFTTSEWNSFQSSGTPLSFKIRAESNEGIWVNDIPTMEESCPGCVFTYKLANLYTTWNTSGEQATVFTSNDYKSDYENVILESGKNHFLGMILDNNNQATRIFTCGVINNTKPFCVESVADGSNFESNKQYVNKVYEGVRCVSMGTAYACGSGNPMTTVSDLHVASGQGRASCHTDADGLFYCINP